MTDESNTMTDESNTGPAWGYRLGDDGDVQSQIFEDGKLPRGWHDTPAKLKKKGARNADNG